MNPKVLAVCLLLTNFSASALPTAKITLKVVDEQGLPIEGAKASLGFTKPIKSGWGTTSSRVSGITDAEGLYTDKGEGETYVSYGAIKDGYYGSGDEYSFNYNESGMIGFRKWQPWNPTVELVLKEIKEPIPLYAVNLAYASNYKAPRIPILDEFVGFDLVARDWVVPHGSGTRKDFLFKLTIDYAKSDVDFDATLTLMFANPDDGIMSVYDEPNKGSMLRLPHHAPVSGYQPELDQRRKRDATKIYTPQPRDDQNYFFRVRSESDGKGNITSALYGKIHGKINFSGVGHKDIATAIVSFTYYLNPKSNDTNLEFNPKKNLFMDLKDSEAIGLTP